MKAGPLSRFVGLLLLIWLAAWFPIGLVVGDYDYVLTTASRGSLERALYQYFLYAGLVGLFLFSWRKHPPHRPRWGRWSSFFLYLFWGLTATVVLRFFLAQWGYAQWAPRSYDGWSWLGLALGCLIVGVAEEAVFRGFLLGHLVQRLGWLPGAWLASLLFAVVHLFRPGEVMFKTSYGVGLTLLGFLLANIAWQNRSILASAGFHCGLIWFNLSTKTVTYQESLLSGFQQEPVSGLVGWIFILAFFLTWRKILSLSHANKHVH